MRAARGERSGAERDAVRGAPHACTPAAAHATARSLTRPRRSHSAFATSELRNAITVSAACAVIATALAVVNALSCALALANSAFAASGDLVKAAAHRGMALNLGASAAWLVSWAVYVRFTALNVSAINGLFVGAGGTAPPAVVAGATSTYGACQRGGRGVRGVWVQGAAGAG